MKWISIKDRLPRINNDSEKVPEFVLIYTPKHFPEIQISYLCKTGWLWEEDRGGQQFFFKMEEVTHWMELPQEPGEKFECNCCFYCECWCQKGCRCECSPENKQ